MSYRLVLHIEGRTIRGKRLYPTRDQARRAARRNNDRAYNRAFDNRKTTTLPYRWDYEEEEPHAHQ